MYTAYNVMGVPVFSS